MGTVFSPEGDPAGQRLERLAAILSHHGLTYLEFKDGQTSIVLKREDPANPPQSAAQPPVQLFVQPGPGQQVSAGGQERHFPSEHEQSTRDGVAGAAFSVGQGAFLGTSSDANARAAADASIGAPSRCHPGRRGEAAASPQQGGGFGAGAAAGTVVAGSGTGAGGADAADTAGSDHFEPVTAPLVGLAYRSKEPGATPFVEVGDEVAQGEVLCLIEAMKLFNEVKAPRAGTISKVLFKDGDLIEYGAPLFLMSS